VVSIDQQEQPAVMTEHLEFPLQDQSEDEQKFMNSGDASQVDDQSRNDPLAQNPSQLNANPTEGG
jgi:hypothetical protein